MTMTAARVAMLAAVCLGLSVPVAAQQSVALSVGARVAPRCVITVDPSTTGDDRSPSIHVQCSRSGLRHLRVTTDRGDGLEPVTTFAGSQLRAGGEVVFVVPLTLATLASRLPVFAPPPQPDRKPVTVTLDF